MSLGPGYACAGCRTIMRPRKNDVCVHITMDDGGNYQLWQGDLWECPDCGIQVILGYASQHWSEHWEVDFKDNLCKVDFTINGQLKVLT